MGKLYASILFFALLILSNTVWAQTATGSFGATTGTTSCPTINQNTPVTSIGPSLLQASVNATGTCASFSGPPWGQSAGMNFRITPTSAIGSFNCIYYGMR